MKTFEAGKAEEVLQKLLDETSASLGDTPFQTPPPFEKLVGVLAGAYSR